MSLTLSCTDAQTHNTQHTTHSTHNTRRRDRVSQTGWETSGNGLDFNPFDCFSVTHINKGTAKVLSHFLLLTFTHIDLARSDAALPLDFFESPEQHQTHNK